jgi:general secretion pathway protein E
MKCEDCRELLTAYVNEELDEQQQEAVAQHLSQCLGCRLELEGIRKVLSIADAADRESITKMVKTLIEKAIPERASDIHIQRTEEGTVVRYRIDGTLHDVMTLPDYSHEPLVARIQQMANMDMTETRVPQDGRIHVHHAGKDYDLRVSSLPTIRGESIVMRILDLPERMPALDDIGMSEGNREAFDELLRSPCGLVVVSGPTGCGKSTTLYAAMRELNRRDHQLTTIEDPVEIMFDGINQVPLNPRAGLTFPVAMRHVMRQDPDIILCGEIRDLATAQLVVQAALTGHLVLTTLHTQTAAGVLRRLADIGVERFLIGESLLGALAQRLVRKICDNCREQRPPTEDEAVWLAEAGVEDIPDQVATGAGCDQCRQTGYRGRTSVHEVLVVDEELRALLSSNAPMDEIEEAAEARVTPIAYDAAQKALQGITDLREAMRIFRHISARDR